MKLADVVDAAIEAPVVTSSSSIATPFGDGSMSSARFRMTGLLLDSLGAGSRVLTMSSGGMYTVPLTVRGIEMDPASYRGTTQYAIAKRSQVTLNEMWSQSRPQVHFHAMHPGWADTPIHRTSRTRRSDTPDRRQRLWEWVADRAGWNLP